MINALALMAIYGSPAIPLSEVCDRFFSLSYPEALRRAARNELPVPTFRLGQSRKAPLMVSCSDLGSFMDKQQAEARQSWLHYQA